MSNKTFSFLKSNPRHPGPLVHLIVKSAIVTAVTDNLFYYDRQGKYLKVFGYVSTFPHHTYHAASRGRSTYLTGMYICTYLYHT